MFKNLIHTLLLIGISGCFPKSKNMYEFIKNLRNKTDMVSDYTRWTMQHPELPKRSGLITDENKLDVGFFGKYSTQQKILPYFPIYLYRPSFYRWRIPSTKKLKVSLLAYRVCNSNISQDDSTCTFNAQYVEFVA